MSSTAVKDFLQTVLSEMEEGCTDCVVILRRPGQNPLTVRTLLATADMQKFDAELQQLILERF